MKIDNNDNNDNKFILPKVELQSIHIKYIYYIIWLSQMNQKLAPDMTQKKL